MTIPDHLVPLLCQLAHEHLVQQLHQTRLLGHDHPQRTRAQFHLDQARQLAGLCPAAQKVAA